MKLFGTQRQQPPKWLFIQNNTSSYFIVYIVSLRSIMFMEVFDLVAVATAAASTLIATGMPILVLLLLVLILLLKFFLSTVYKHS